MTDSDSKKIMDITSENSDELNNLLSKGNTQMSTRLEQYILLVTSAWHKAKPYLPNISSKQHI